jgi:coproporphyrinogen III oxidase-like Fe-S oxidoreductase
VSLGLSAQGYAPRAAYHNVDAIKPYYQLLDQGKLPVATVN